MTIRYKRGVMVTPAMARKWLDKNADNNRSPKMAKVASYARDMEEGNWQADTGETVKFDEDGVLIDGQNRLHAVVESGVTVSMDVAYNVPNRAMRVLDTGSARTAADVLKIAGAADRMRCSAIVRWAIMWDAGGHMGHNTGSIRPTTTEIIERYVREAGAFNAASSRGTDCQRRGLATGGPAGVAHYLFSRIDREEARAFFDQYVGGANLPEKGPIVALRNRVLTKLTRAEQLALLIRAWNFYRADELVDRLQISRGELTNANFPQPK